MQGVGGMIYRARETIAYWGRARAARRVLARGSVEPLFVVGLSRSGSTWLQETLGAWPGTLSLFEPIHKRVPGSAAALTLEDVGGEHMSEDEARVMQGVVRGAMLAPRVLPAGSVPVGAVRRVCVKLINANNGLPRVVNDLKPRLTPVVILRHPCAHVASWKRLNWTGKFGGLQLSYPRLLAQRPEWARVVAGLSTPLDYMVGSWCLGNYVPLFEEPRGRWRVVRYEDLLRDPQGELAGMFRMWNEDDVPTAVREAVARASRTTWREDKGAVATAETWQTELTDVEVREVVEVCARFGVRVDEGSYGLA